MIGFIITRHVCSEVTNKYWNESYRTIRKFYPTELIMIIDDNSLPQFVHVEDDLFLMNCIIIQSEFRGAGEILPYYYFLKYQLFEKAVILHDSVFLQSRIDFEKIEDVHFLWHFTQHCWDNIQDEVGLLQYMTNNTKLIEFYHQKHLWYGCFGAQSIVSLRFLQHLEDTYQFSRILPHVSSRVQRYAIERILGCMFTMEKRSLLHNPSLFGIIFDFLPWGFSFSNYLEHSPSHLPVIKVWSER